MIRLLTIDRNNKSNELKYRHNFAWPVLKGSSATNFSYKTFYFINQNIMKGYCRNFKWDVSNFIWMLKKFVSWLVDSIVHFFYIHSCWRNKPRSEVTLLNWRQFRRDKLPLFMPGQDWKFKLHSQSWPGMNRGSLSLQNCSQFNKVTSERVLLLHR